MKNIFKIFLLTFLVASCAGVGSSKISAQQKTAIKKLGVYSNFDSTMHIFLAGAHQYDHNEKEIKMPVWWSLNKAAKNSAKDKLKNIEVGSIKFEGENGSEENRIKNALKVAKSQGFDTALIILPKVDKNNPLLKPSYGMVRYSQEIQQGYTSFSVNLYDVASGDLIKQINFDDNAQENILFKLQLDFREYFNYHRDEVEKLMHAYEGEISLKVYNALEEIGL